MYKSESVVLDAPPLPSRSPHEQLDDLPELKSTTNVFGEKGSSPRPSTPPRITGFQPGSLEAEEFYKSQSNHPIPPVPPRSSPTPGNQLDVFERCILKKDQKYTFHYKLKLILTSFQEF